MIYIVVYLVLYSFFDGQKTACKCTIQIPPESSQITNLQIITQSCKTELKIMKNTVNNPKHFIKHKFIFNKPGSIYNTVCVLCIRV